MTEAVPAYGRMVNSGPLTGTPRRQGLPGHGQIPGRKRHRALCRQLPPARLADLAPALLGRAHSDRVL
jgi:hypothetical protein